jgi:cobalamin biosynthesis protein CobT
MKKSNDQERHASYVKDVMKYLKMGTPKPDEEEEDEDEQATPPVPVIGKY